MVRACAHCHKPASKHEWNAPRELLLRMVQQSLAGHDAVCRNTRRLGRTG